MSRRTTLGLLSENNRLSMATPMGRPSLIKPGGGPQRLSLAPNRTSLVGRSSDAGSASSNQRSSAFSRPTEGGRPKDPRNIRDKGYQHQCVSNLIKFLTEAGYDRPLSPKLVHQPTAKDFQHIFIFLYRQIDPAYVAGSKFEDEVPIMLRAIGYPFYAEISKSQLLAVGSPHAWPVLLAMLTWMVELILACDLNAMKEEPAAAVGEKLFFSFLSNAYQQWLDGNDSFELLASDLAQNFDKKNAIINEDLKRINKQSEAMRAQLAKLDSEQPPLAMIQGQQQQLSSDLEKLQKLIELLSAKIAKKEQVNSRLQNELDAINQEIETSSVLQRQLRQQVETQPISMEKAQQLQANHSRLTESVRRIGATKEEVTKDVWANEITQAKRLDQIEQVVRRYNNLAEHRHVDLIEFSPTSIQEISKAIRFAMEKIGDDKQTSHDDGLHIQDTLLAIDATIKQIDDEINDLEFELLQQQSKLNDLQTQENDYKQAVRKVYTLKVEYDNATRVAAAEKEKFSKQVLSVLDLLVQHKAHIETSVVQFKAELDK